MPDADLDLRLVRYFVVVAGHGNFRRAAAALHLAQPSLSRQIQQLEERLGARLLDRDSRGTRLTEAGEVFLPQAQALLALAREAAATTREAGQAAESFTIGYTGDLLVTDLVRELRDWFPGARIGALHVDFGDVPAALLDHRVDAVLTREPFAADRLRVTPLYDEGRILVVWAGHPLADCAEVTPEDFADEVMVGYEDPIYDAFWRPTRHLDGPRVTNTHDKLEVVADRQAVALAPASGNFRAARPGIAAVPVRGLPPCRVVLATRQADDRKVTETAIAAARIRCQPSAAA